MRARVRKAADDVQAPVIAPWSVRAAATLPKGAVISNPLLGDDPRGTIAVLDEAAAPGIELAALAALAKQANGALVVLERPDSVDALFDLGFTPFTITGCKCVFGATYPLPTAPWLQKAEWSTKYVNALPDSAFLHVLDGGEKDDEGKTVPRDLRMFPFKDKDGNVDLPHLQNALSRIPQSNRIDQATKDRLTAKAQKLLTAATDKAVRISKPFAGYSTFDECVVAQVEGGRSEESARAVCGKLQAEAEKAYAISLLTKSARVEKDDDGTEERYVLGVVLEPDSVDSQGDTITAAEIRQAAHKYLETAGNVGLQHQVFVNGKVNILESYVAPVGFSIGDEVVKAGSWLMAFRIVDDAIWKAVKAGTLNGLSIGGTGLKIPVA